MQRVIVKPDTLDQQNRRFEQQPLAQPLFLNSVPKSGTHLLRNIIRMFVPVPQQYKREFIQHPILHQHLAAFDKRTPLLSWGHLLFSDQAAIELAGVRKILLIRDPYSWVLSCARFLQSDQFSGLDHLKSGAITAEQMLNIVIFGIWQKLPSLSEHYLSNAVAWLGTDVYLIRFEELKQAVATLDTDDSELYFAALLDACGIDVPVDWRERVRMGADPAESGTSEQNLQVRIDIPKVLPAVQQQLVDHVAPGLRKLLGYE
jgi:hypothetical protein